MEKNNNKIVKNYSFPEFGFKLIIDDKNNEYYSYKSGRGMKEIGNTTLEKAEKILGEEITNEFENLAKELYAKADKLREMSEDIRKNGLEKYTLQNKSEGGK